MKQTRQTSQIVIRGLDQVFDSAGARVTALRDINLDVAAGEFVCLLGPSGCGKSTLLNAIAGFVAPSAGEVVVDGRPVVGPGPDRGMVFQEYALFPWMSVAENVGFGLKIQHKPRDEIEATIAQLLDLLHLSDFADRFPKDL